MSISLRENQFLYSILFVLKFIVGAFASYWAITGLCQPLLNKYSRPISSPELYLGAGLGAILFVYAGIAWLLILFALYAYNSINRKK